MAEGIHQFYATHCTYGSSALERRDGHTAERVLGYSARAGSMSVRTLQERYNALERFLSYQLPSDAPGERKLELDARTAPCRLVYHNSVSGLQMIANVCYRRYDAAEKSAGSYFAHVLVDERSDDRPPWSVLDAVQLWQSPRWIVEDSHDISHQLELLKNLSAMVQVERVQVEGSQAEDKPHEKLPPINDHVLHSFLTATDRNGFYTPNADIVPDRWRSMDVADRQRYFGAALRGFLGIASDPRRSLLLVVEPSVSLLFFYGIARVLPAGPIRGALSFSTFESNPMRLSTRLAATYFENPTIHDVDPELYEREFVINTVNGQQTPLADGASPYAQTILDKLYSEVDNCWPEIDRLLTATEASSIQTVTDLDRVAAAEKVSRQITSPPAEIGDSWRKDPVQLAFLRKHVLSQLPELCVAPALSRFKEAPVHVLTILYLAAGRKLDRQALTALARLCETLPADQLCRLLKMPDVQIALKFHILKKYVCEHRSIPPDCDFLWRMPSDDIESDHDLSRSFEKIIDGLNIDGLKGLFGNAPKQFQELFLIKLVDVLGRNASKLTSDNDDPRLTFLARHIQGLDADGICQLLLQVPPPDDLPGCMRKAFGRPLLKLLDSLHDHADEFKERIDLLTQNYQLVKRRTDEYKLNGIPGTIKSENRQEAWMRLRKTLEDVARDGVKSNQSSWLKRLGKKDARLTPDGLGECLARHLELAVPDALFDDVGPQQRGICIRHILKSMGMKTSVLPDDFQRKIESYATDPHRRWPPSASPSKI